MATPESLLAEQVAVGSRITKFIDNATRGVKDGSRSAYQSRLELLERYWSQFEFADRGLRAFQGEPSAKSYFQGDHYSMITDAYCEAKSWVTDQIARFDLPSSPLINPTSPVMGHLDSHYFEKIKLPRFDGNLKEWDEFKNKFTSLILDDKFMSTTIKFQHLLNSLDGKAADLLKGFEVTGDKFASAWEHLCSTYNNRAHRFYVHMEALVTLPAASRETASHLNSLLTTANQSVSVFRNLGCPVEYWDEIMIFLLESKVALMTRRDWLKRMRQKPADEPPKFADFKKFLEARISDMHTLGTAANESPHHTGSKPKASASNKKSNSKVTVMATSVTPDASKAKKKTGCVQCGKPHFIAYCHVFKQMSAKDRRQTVLRKQLCFNCLKPNHRVEKCPSENTCSSCGQKHNSMLHVTQPNTTGVGGDGTLATIGVAAIRKSDGKVTRTTNQLATATVILENPDGGKVSARALLDSCAQKTIISEQIAQVLSLTRIKASTYLTGSGGTTAAVARHRANIIVSSPIDANFQLATSAIILHKVSNPLKGHNGKITSLNEFKNLTLADPVDNHYDTIDCILSSFVYGRVMRPGLIQPTDLSLPAALNTAFGWIFLGPVPDAPRHNQAAVFVSLSADRTLSDAVEKFWAVEEVPSAPKWSPDEQQCMDQFDLTHTRNSEGRFVVRLPLKSTPTPCHSREMAISCYQRLETRLSKDGDLASKYHKFMNEYKSLGHLRQLKKPMDHGYFLPHHAVLRQDTGKIRVVFNASQRDAKGASLNDVMHVGPKLHTDIVIIFLRWCFYPHVFTFDIIKMFRQFLVHPSDQLWQQIFWRWSAEEGITVQKLTTVTYGTAAAPFLANACLLQLAKDEAQRYPEAATVVEQNRYIDDFFVGADTVSSIEKLRHDLISMLASAGMQTDKFACNYDPEGVRHDNAERVHIPVVEDEVVSLLGLQWNPHVDHFRYKVKVLPLTQPITKRSILSKVASLFDPIGWLCPIIVKAKMVLQHMWILGYDWDMVVTPRLQEAWTNYHSGLTLIDQITVPRWVGTHRTFKLTLHGFSDASQRTYGVAIYAVTSEDNEFHSHLIFAKSKVTPIKVIKVPRLELCAAHLLAKSIRYIVDALQSPPEHVYCWSDARTVLSWLKGYPSRWKTFVANRVSDIITITPQFPWNYVKTVDNPADLTSRGCAPEELIGNELWWNGPPWLKQNPSHWPLVEDSDKEKPRQAAGVNEEDSDDPKEEAAKPFDSKWICTTKTEWSASEWIEQFSSLDKPVAALAISRRWLYRVRRDGLNPEKGPLTAYELKRARTRLIAMVHRETFHAETLKLAKGKSLPKRSLLRNFSPFLDVEGILQAESRLQYSHLSENERYPILMPAEHHLTWLLVRETHFATLHGGMSLVLSVLLRNYWIIKGRTAVRKVLNECVTCARHHAKTAQPKMAPLPSARTMPSRPFTHTGLDYAGPFLIKRSPSRGAKCYKGYIAIFVCLAVKAVHFELVSDYTSSSFLAAFRRFSSRRGLPKIIYSDNGTTFREANAEIQRLFQQSSNFVKDSASSLAKAGVEWSFIPPQPPNFGGLWEANIKSFKSHLKKTIGLTKLTFEELSTVASQIEACLNSRPLSVIHMEHDAPLALTPGHFLSGGILLSVPSAPEADSPTMSYKTRWEHLQCMVRHFWRRWAREYLTQLHGRTKWLDSGRAFQIGDVVLIRDDLTPSGQWPMGKVIQLYQRKDNICCVAKLKTSASELTRPVSKLILLPTNDRTASFLCQNSEI